MSRADHDGHSRFPLRRAIGALGVLSIGQGLWMASSPGSFFDTVADYGVRNDHLIRDLAMVSLAIGVVLLIASVRRPWRVPALSFATIWYGLHAANHARDIGDADSTALGVFNTIVLAALAALLGYMWFVAVRDVDD